VVTLEEIRLLDVDEAVGILLTVKKNRVQNKQCKENNEDREK
jgi:hypothetical protein